MQGKLVALPDSYHHRQAHQQQFYVHTQQVALPRYNLQLSPKVQIKNTTIRFRT